MKKKHPSRYTRDDVYNLCDRLMHRSSSCEDEQIKDLLREAGKVLLNREIILGQIANAVYHVKKDASRLQQEDDYI